MHVKKKNSEHAIMSVKITYGKKLNLRTNFNKKKRKEFLILNFCYQVLKSDCFLHVHILWFQL